MSKILNLGEWKDHQFLPLNLDCYTANPTYKHGTLEEIDNNETSNRITDMRKAAEAHRIVRKHIQDTLKPGVNIETFCESLENKTREILSKNLGLQHKESGIGFPTSFSINNCVAHDSPIKGDKRVVHKDDIIKVDFGTHVNGNIIDCAFTASWNEKYKPLVNATKEATWEGIKMAGPDAVINDISERISEVISSHEMELNGKTYQINPVKNLGGHDIYPYEIHGGAIILGGRHPQVPNSLRMKADTCYAIETFASTGKGWAHDDPNLPTTLYKIKNLTSNQNFRLTSTRKLFNHLKNKYNKLPFCTRWLERDFPKYKVPLGQLVKYGVVNAYPPLSDDKESLSSQLEHTIYLHDFGKEVLSVGKDY